MLITSCGITTGGHKYLKSGAYLAGLEDGTPGYACPSNNNVRPDFDHWLDGSGYFKACPSDTNAGEILLKGNPTGGNFLYVYPVEFISPTEIFTKEDTTNGGILSQLISNFNQDGTPVNFGNSLIYNSVFVVDFANKAQMDICLAAQDYFFCPPYSFGKFK